MSATDTTRVESLQVRQATRVPLLQQVIRFFRNKPLGASGAAILVFLIFCGVFAPLLTPYDPWEIDSSRRILPPGLPYVFGTDMMGRDVLSRLLYGARVSVGVGFSTIVLSTVIAAGIGLASANWEGKFDLVTQRFVDAVMAIPTLVLLLAAGFTLGRGALILIVLLGFLFGVRSSRVVRSQALSIKQNDYVTAARALGATNLRIMVQHMLPNLFAPIMVLSTVQLGAVILTEASLSFLQLGIPPPAISWGQMISAQGWGTPDMSWMIRAPWMIVTPGLAITAAVWGANMFGDALRDTLDPRLRGRGT